MAVEWTNMNRDIWQAALQATPSAVVPRSLGWDLICLWQSWGVSGAAYTIPQLFQQAALGQHQPYAWSLSPVPASGKQKNNSWKHQSVSPGAALGWGIGNIWEVKEEQEGFCCEKALSQHCDTGSGAVNFHPKWEELVQLLGTQEQKVGCKHKCKMSRNWGSFYSCRGTGTPCQCSTFLPTRWDILAIQLLNLGGTRVRELSTLCSPNDKVLLAHNLCSACGWPGCWGTLQGGSGLVPSPPHIPSSESKGQAAARTLHTAVNSCSRDQWKALLLFVSLHKAGLCGTGTWGVRDAPDASVSSPGGGAAPWLSCTHHPS